MAVRRVSLAALAIVVVAMAIAPRSTLAQVPDGPVIKLAELEIDPAQVVAYKVALRRGIEAAIRLEPGVITLYAVSVRNQPNQIRLFEQYRDPAAYQAHLRSAHFLRCKAETAHMVKSLRLIETDPILLSHK